MLRLRLREGVGGSVLVATPDSVHRTIIRLRLRLRLGGEVGGSGLLATQDSVHSAFFELRLRLRLRLKHRLARV